MIAVDENRHPVMLVNWEGLHGRVLALSWYGFGKEQPSSANAGWHDWQVSVLIQPGSPIDNITASPVKFVDLENRSDSQTP
jgi:hypothetical protein